MKSYKQFFEKTINRNPSFLSRLKKIQDEVLSNYPVFSETFKDELAEDQWFGDSIDEMSPEEIGKQLSAIKEDDIGLEAKGFLREYRKQDWYEALIEYTIVCVYNGDFVNMIEDYEGEYTI